jgi:hypothetical protein
MENVEESLCSYDKRNPDHECDADEDRKPRDDCYCDSCFYGRDELALEIIRLTEELKKERSKGI